MSSYSVQAVEACFLDLTLALASTNIPPKSIGKMKKEEGLTTRTARVTGGQAYIHCPRLNCAFRCRKYHLYYIHVQENPQCPNCGLYFANLSSHLCKSTMFHFSFLFPERLALKLVISHYRRSWHCLSIEDGGTPGSHRSYWGIV